MFCVGLLLVVLLVRYLRKPVWDYGTAVSEFYAEDRRRWQIGDGPIRRRVEGGRARSTAAARSVGAVVRMSMMGMAVSHFARLSRPGGWTSTLRSTTRDE